MNGKHAACTLVLFFMLKVISPAFCGGLVMAQGLDEITHDEPSNGTKPMAVPWREVVGKRVEVQGIAWGVFEKGAGEYIILNKAVVYTKDAGFLKASASGRLVKASGVLTLRKVKGGGMTSSGPNSDRDIFELAEIKWEFIDNVTWPWLRLSREGR